MAHSPLMLWFDSSRQRPTICTPMTSPPYSTLCFAYCLTNSTLEPVERSVKFQVKRVIHPGDPPYKNDGYARREIFQNTLKGIRILLDGCGSHGFLFLRSSNSKTTHELRNSSWRILFSTQYPKSTVIVVTLFFLDFSLLSSTNLQSLTPKRNDEHPPPPPI